MARHHVISTTACDVFFKLVAHQKKSLGARFDSMIVTFSADGQPVLGATLRDAKSGCELHRLAGQPAECWCCGYDEQLEFVSPANVPLAHADYRHLEQWRNVDGDDGCQGAHGARGQQAGGANHPDRVPAARG